MKAILAALLMVGCTALDKDNDVKEPSSVSEDIRSQRNLYAQLLAPQMDSYGLAVMGSSIGDSALFSCLARVAGATSFDPAVLLTEDGKPRRHPDIAPGISKTPISKDMVNGIMWCMYDLIHKGDKDRARDLLSQMIDFGKANKLTVGVDVGWLFCTEKDREAYQISDADWLGRCFMPPAILKDIYRLAKKAGMECDDDCMVYSTIGPNIPADKTGFERHLAVITTVRNGLVDGGINDNSLKIVLQKAAEAQPRNALYQAAYHLFRDGVQDAAYKALQDEALFPASALPTSANYCTDYLFQRDEDQKDWVPCPDGGGPEGRGIEWSFAAALALGEVL